MELHACTSRVVMSTKMSINTNPTSQNTRNFTKDIHFSFTGNVTFIYSTIYNYYTVNLLLPKVP